MTVKNERRRVMKLLPAWCLVGAGLLPSMVSAQATPPFPTTFQIEEEQIQKVPTRFKLQARVSQGKIPTGDATFERVIVNLRDHAGTVCTETLNNVRVRDSVLNIDVGPSMPNCPLDEIIASRANLEFQICVNNTESCLKPISLSSVPFAVKASYAAQAQEAHKSDIAAQCNYAHRVTADRDLFVTQEVGTGYYDFHTPTSSELLMVDGQSMNGGYIQWTPVNSVNKLNVCARNQDTGALQRLGELALHADLTRVAGELRVSGAAHVAGNANVGGSLNVTQGATIGGDTQVAGNTSLMSNVDVGGDLGVAGHSSLATLGVAGAANVGGGLTVAGNSHFASGGEFVFDGDVVFHGGITLPPGGIVASESVNSLAVIDNSLQSVDIANGTITAVDLADNSITGSKIGPAQIDIAHLRDGSVNSNKLGAGSVGEQHIINGAVTNAKIALGAVNTEQIAPGAVRSAQIADGEVAAGKLGPLSVATANIQNLAVRTEQLGNAQVTDAKLATSSVRSNHIHTGQVLSSHIGGGQVNGSHLGSAVVSSGHIAASSIGSSHVADRSLTGLDIRSTILGHAHSPNVDQIILFNGSNGTATIRKDTYGQCFLVKVETYKLGGFCYISKTDPTYWGMRLSGTQCEIACF